MKGSNEDDEFYVEAIVKLVKLYESYSHVILNLDGLYKDYWRPQSNSELYILC